MRLLAVDTSSRDMSAAVVAEGKLLSFYVNKGGNSSDESIVPCIDFALSEAGMSLGDIDVFAAVQGPGSFTGLRIGISVIKAFAYARNKPCVGVSTLDVLAYAVTRHDTDTGVSELTWNDTHGATVSAVMRHDTNVAGGSYVCPVMDARNNRYYTAIFGMRSVESVLNPCVLDFGALTDVIKSLKNGAPSRKPVHVIFTGDAAHKVFADFSTVVGVNASLSDEAIMIQNAGAAALLAYSECMARPREVLKSSAVLAPLYMNDGYYNKSR